MPDEHSKQARLFADELHDEGLPALVLLEALETMARLISRVISG